MLKFGYTILNDFKLIVKKHSGTVNLNNIIESNIIITKDELFNQNFNLITDFREVIVNLESDDIENLFRNLSNINPGKRKIAFIGMEPMSHTFAFLFKRKVIKSDYQLFSTVSAACKFLETDFKIINKYLDDINNNKNILTID